MQLCANRLARAMRITFVAADRRRCPFGTAGLHQILFAHLLVALETTRAEQHAALGVDLHALAVLFNDHAGHTARCVLHQFLERGLAPHVHARLVGSGEQPGDECLATREATVTSGLVAPWVVEKILQHHADDGEARFEFARKHRMRLERVDAHATEQLIARRAGAHGLQRGHAELGGVEIDRVHGAATGLRSFDVRVVVRILGHAAVRNADLLEVLGHLAGGFHIGQHAVVARHAAHAAHHVAEGRGQIVLDASALLVVVHRNPDAAARQRRGATEQLRLFHHQSAQALLLGANRTQQSTRARADHHHVIFLNCHAACLLYLSLFVCVRPAAESPQRGLVKTKAARLLGRA